MSVFSRLSAMLRSVPSAAATYLDNRLTTIETTLAGLAADGTFDCDAGLAADDVVYISAANTVALADANGSGTYPAIGVIVSKPTSTTALVRFCGLVEDAGTFTAGAIQYLSETAGDMTETAPTAPGAAIVGIAVNTTDLLVLPLGALSSILRSTAANLGASLIAIRDAGTLITATTVEGALAELAQFKADLGLTTNAKGASLVAIEDAATQLTATNVETALAELAAKFAAGLTPAITKLQIATGTLVAGEATINTNIVVTANTYVIAMPTADVTGSTNFGSLSNTRASNSVGGAGVGSVLIRALGNDGAKDADAAGAFVALLIN